MKILQNLLNILKQKEFKRINKIVFSILLILIVIIFWIVVYVMLFTFTGIHYLLKNFKKAIYFE